MIRPLFPNLYGGKAAGTLGTLYVRKLGKPGSLSGHHEEEKYFYLTGIEFRFADKRDEVQKLCHKAR
jgi:hypothetical protein